MGLNVGTLVRPYQSGDSDSTDGTAEFTCKSDVCVGIISELLLVGQTLKRSNALAKVEWYHTCELHKTDIVRMSAKAGNWYMADDLWEIGQIY